MIGELGVGDRDLSAQRRRAPRIRHLPAFIRSSIVASIVVSMRLTKKLATEDMRETILAPGDAVLEAGEKGLGDRLVHVDREQQGDVDVDAARGELADRRHARARARHLDHQIGPVDVGPEPARLVDRLRVESARKGETSMLAKPSAPFSRS